MPARVVLGAEVPEGGVVTGKDVSAWVELRAADGSWRTLPTEAFMSDEPPADQLPETNTPMTGTVVPPPAPIPPPSDAGDQSDADLKERKADKKEADEEEDEESVVDRAARLDRRWSRRTSGARCSPSCSWSAPILGLKLLRRRRRRNAAVVSARFVGAWRELVDHARDLGQPVPLGPTVTRREQSGAIGSEQAPVPGAPRRRLRLRPEHPRGGRPRRRTGRLWTPSDARCRGPWVAVSGCSPRSTCARCGRPGRGCVGCRRRPR